MIKTKPDCLDLLCRHQSIIFIGYELKGKYMEYILSVRMHCKDTWSDERL